MPRQTRKQPNTYTFTRRRIPYPRANQDIRAEAKKYGVRLWMIADRLGMWDTNFTRMLRKELDPEAKKKIMDIIHEIAAQGGVRCEGER